MKTLIVGLGNPMLGDDGVGWKIAEIINRQLPPDGSIIVDRLSSGGISLMQHFIGYDRVILIDAFASEAEIGSVHIMKLKEIPGYSAFHVSSQHDISLQKAIGIGKSIGADLPEDITVVGISTPCIHDFCSELSSPVVEAIPLATQAVLDLLK